MAKGTIRHPAIVAKDPEKLADYYRKVFSIEEVHRDNKAKKPGGKIGVFLTDGYLNPAILPLGLDGENALGIHHFGFIVEDLEEMLRRIEEHGGKLAEPLLTGSTGNTVAFVAGPDGVIIELVQPPKE